MTADPHLRCSPNNQQQPQVFEPGINRQDLRKTPTPYRRQPSVAESSPNTLISQKVGPIKLKGVDLPTFDSENKVDYEQWKAAFTSAVDYASIPVNKKMLRLQNRLKGKALKLVKDLGISSNAYERAKEKLDKKYGGQR